MHATHMNQPIESILFEGLVHRDEPILFFYNFCDSSLSIISFRNKCEHEEQSIEMQNAISI